MNCEWLIYKIVKLFGPYSNVSNKFAEFSANWRFKSKKGIYFNSDKWFIWVSFYFIVEQTFIMLENMWFFGSSHMFYCVWCMTFGLSSISIFHFETTNSVATMKTHPSFIKLVPNERSFQMIITMCMCVCDRLWWLTQH